MRWPWSGQGGPRHHNPARSHVLISTKQQNILSSLKQTNTRSEFCMFIKILYPDEAVMEEEADEPGADAAVGVHSLPHGVPHNLFRFVARLVVVADREHRRTSRRRCRARRGRAWWRVARRAWCRVRRSWARWRRVAWRAWIVPCHTAKQRHEGQGGKLTTGHLRYGIVPREMGGRG